MVNYFKRLVDMRSKRKRIYLDYAAATPVHPEVASAMEPYLSNVWGNPSAIHAEGLLARAAIERARKELAALLHVRASHIVFTSCGTESNNLALYGLVRHLHEAEGRDFSDMEVITTALEHPSILRVTDHLKEIGVRVHLCPVDAEGLIVMSELSKLLSERTILVTCAYANSEIGVVQDVKRIARMVKKFNTDTHGEVRVHVDASQAPLWLPIEIDMLGCDMLTLDAGKCYGPKGVGVLALRHGVQLKGILLGGDQEGGLRAGTESPAFIVGCVEAIVRAERNWKSRSEAVASLRDFLIGKLETTIDGVVVNGSREHRIANNVNISIPGVDSEFAVVALDAKGIAASTKSACSGASGGGSLVVAAISGDTARATSTIRFSLGEETTKRELAEVVRVLSAHVASMRKAFPENALPHNAERG